MELLERAIYLTIGGGIGFILGYIVARLRTIETKVDEVKKEVHEVDDIVKHNRDDKGFVKLSALALAFVVLLTAFAAFASASANSKLNNTVDCVVEYSTGQAEALKSRDLAISGESEEEIELWALYDKLYDEAEENPKAIPRLQKELNAAINAYRRDLIQTQATREAYAYPDPETIRNCDDKESTK